MAAPKSNAKSNLVGVPAEAGGAIYIVAPAGLPAGAHSLTMAPVLLARFSHLATSIPVATNESVAIVEAIADSSVRDGLIVVHDRDGHAFAELDMGGGHSFPTIRHLKRASESD